MILPLSLLLAARAQTTPAADLAAVIESSNRIRYALPQVTNALSFSNKATISEARSDGRSHGRWVQNGNVVLEAFDDGERSIALNHTEKSYSTATRTGPRPTYAEATKDPLPELETDHFDIRFDSNRGLILRSNPALLVVTDEPAVTVGSETWRRITGRTPGSSAPGSEQRDVTFRVFVDATGLIRLVEGETVMEEGGKTTFRFTCDPKVAPDEAFTYDVSKLDGWTKTEAGQDGVDPLKPILDVSNRLFYDLPEVTYEMTLTFPNVTQSVREARRGAAVHTQVRRDDLLATELFKGPARELYLKFDEKTYSESPRVARKGYEASLREADAPRSETGFTVNFHADRGLSFSALPAGRIVKDEPKVEVDGKTYRRVTCLYRIADPAGGVDKANGEYWILIDGTGLVRKSEGTIQADGKDFLSFRIVCDPTVPADEPFDFDVARLTDWTKK